MIKIKTDKGTFTVNVRNGKTGSNYNIMASIFFNKDKTPICGTSFKEAAPADEIKAWAEQQVKNYPKSITR